MACCAPHDIGSAYLRVYQFPNSSIPSIYIGSFIALGTHQTHFCSKAFELPAPSTLKILALALCETVPFQHLSVQIEHLNLSVSHLVKKSISHCFN